MPISDEQRAKVRAAAEQAGLDPDKAVRLAEEMAAGKSTGKEEKPASEPPKLFQYQLPALRCSEVRAYLKMIGAPLEDAPMPEESLPWGQWLAKYGGQPTGGSATAAEEAPPAE